MVFKDFSQWMAEQFTIGKNLGISEVGLPISSDTIESLFSVAKYHGVGTIKDPNRIAMRIPALCGELTPQDAERVMDISTSELDAFVGGLPSLTTQRRKILPNPGTLEQLADQAAYTNVELLPGSRNWEKVAENPLQSWINAKKPGSDFSNKFHPSNVRQSASPSPRSTA
jgi:hypothetical protein